MTEPKAEPSWQAGLRQKDSWTCEFKWLFIFSCLQSGLPVWCSESSLVHVAGVCNFLSSCCLLNLSLSFRHLVLLWLVPAASGKWLTKDLSSSLLGFKEVLAYLSSGCTHQGYCPTFTWIYLSILLFSAIFLCRLVSRKFYYSVICTSSLAFFKFYSCAVNQSLIS